jgi:hypothetical protein
VGTLLVARKGRDELMENLQRDDASPIENIFQNLDKIVLRAMEGKNAESILHDAYIEFWTKVKQKVGTSSQFTGVAEYLLFRYIMKYVEQNMNIKFNPHEETPDTFSFRSKNMLMTHDIDISKFMPGPIQRPHRPDIAVFAVTGNGFRLLAVFELKIFISSPNLLVADLARLRRLGETGALLFEVILAKPTVGGKKLLFEFCSSPELTGRAFVVSKHDMKCNIELNHALDKLIESTPV